VQGQLHQERTALTEVRASLQLREVEVERLTRELVQESVAFEDLRIAGKEKDASVLQLQWEAEAARADLEKEKKQVEGKLWPPSPLFVNWFHRDSLLTRLFFLPGPWTAPGVSATQAEVLQTAYNSSQ
jgi:hypothetical protein